ncbi:MAG: hypothetical protein ACRDHW_11140, partial [Ktedonobacteraceae bacterium]
SLIISQWVWNVRLELGHQLHPDPVRTTEFASAYEENAPVSSPPQGYGPACAALSWKAGRFSGQDFPLQSDGTLRCPAGQSLVLQEQRREAKGSVRLVYGASIRSCRPCPLREQCQWEGSHTAKPRQVSLLLHPLAIGTSPLLWRDWSRRFYRRACMQLVRSQRLEVESHPALAPPPDSPPGVLSRAQRAHYRLTFQERLARNQLAPTARRVTITLFGVPASFAASLGFATA